MGNFSVHRTYLYKTNLSIIANGSTGSKRERSVRCLIYGMTENRRHGPIQSFGLRKEQDSRWVGWLFIWGRTDAAYGLIMRSFENCSLMFWSDKRGSFGFVIVLKPDSFLFNHWDHCSGKEGRLLKLCIVCREKPTIVNQSLYTFLIKRHLYWYGLTNNVHKLLVKAWCRAAHKLQKLKSAGKSISVH